MGSSGDGYMIFDKLAAVCFDLVTHSAKLRQPIIIRCIGWVGEAVVNVLRRGREIGALFAGVVANRDHIVERQAGIFVGMVRGVMGNINPILSHDLDRKGIGPMGGNSGAVNLRPLSGKMLQIAVGHLRAGGIASA